MGYILLNHIDLGAVPATNQIVRIDYRRKADPDIAEAYTFAGNVVAKPNGDLVAPFYIQNIPDGVQYIVKMSSTCLESVILKEYNTGVTTAAPTTTGPVTTAAPTTTTPITTAAPTTTLAATTTGAPTTTLPSCPDIMEIHANFLEQVNPTTTVAPTTTSAPLPANVQVINSVQDNRPLYAYPVAKLKVVSGPSFTGQTWVNPYAPLELQAGNPAPFPAVNTGYVARGGERTINLTTGATYNQGPPFNLQIYVDGVLFSTTNSVGFFPSNQSRNFTFSAAQIAAATTIEFRFIPAF